MGLGRATIQRTDRNRPSRAAQHRRPVAAMRKRLPFELTEWPKAKCSTCCRPKWRRQPDEPNAAG